MSDDREGTEVVGDVFWVGLDERRLVVQSCEDCGRLRWPSRPMCGNCGSWRTGRTELVGRATVVSWIVTHHRYAKASVTPFTTVLAALDEQPDITMLGRYDGDPARLHGGMAVAAGFSTDEAGRTLINWMDTGGHE